MRFGPVSLDAAEGAILAHSVGLPVGRLRKGKRLTATDIEKLRTAGIDTVTVARLERGDVHEDRAAERLARALVPDPVAVGLKVTKATTGRVNLIAEGPGVVEIDANRIHQINSIDPMITVATVPPWQRLGAGGLAATIKIISYAVPETALLDAEAEAAGALVLHPPKMREASLVQTTVGAEDGTKGHEALAARLSQLSVSLSPKTVVAHEAVALASALTASDGEILFILTGSATSDLRDVAPEAVRMAGGTVEHFGMPVDPGNLLFLGTLKDRPVVGLPGCARSPALNGADWVLERLICGLAVVPEDIMGMGVGGLLKEIPSRPSPRRGGPVE